MSSFSILIIDDSQLINNALAQSLRERGYKVEQAFDVKTAQDLLREKEFNYALLDLELPDGTGEDVLPYLQIHEEIRVIVMTSDRDKQRREHLFDFGIVIDYVTKERYFADMELSIVELIENISTNHNLNFLVVDDSRFMRNQLRILLSKRGFNVYEAIDGKDALDVIKKHQIDAAIIDLEMPVMDGNKLLSAIKRNKANLLMPVMVVSGSSDPDKIAKVIKNGASDFIKKPYANEELVLKVDKMIRDLKQSRLIKIQESRFALYNKAIDTAAIFFKLDVDLNILINSNTTSESLCDGIEVYNNTPLAKYLENSDLELIELKKHIDRKETYQEIFTFKNSHFTESQLRLTFTPILGDEDKIDEIIVIGFDVSLLHEKENSLKNRVEVEATKNWEQNKLLIQQSKMAAMGEMIGHIGHQWRQPLSSLSLLFQKIDMAKKRDRLSDATMSSSTEKAMRIISQMSKTIDDFRDFFKSDKEWKRCKVSDVLNQALGLIEPTLKSENIKLILDKENDTTFTCLKNEFSQVLLNIIANSVDAVVSKNIANPEISIAIETKNKDVIVLIEDNAGGIDEAIVERIFEPYFTTKESTNGTGIGLYMSKIIIEENLNGKIEVANILGGVLFKIIVPIDGVSNDK